MSRILTENEWNYLLCMIYHCNRAEDINQFNITVLKQIKILIPYTEGRIYKMNRNCGKITPLERFAYGEKGIGYADDYRISEFDNDNACFWPEFLYAPQSQVFRNTDLSDAFEKFLRSELYKEIYAPQNMHYSLKIVLIYENELSACISLCRPKDDVDFSTRDIYICNLLKDHLAQKMSQILKQTGTRTPSLRPSDPIIEKIGFERELTKREQEVLGELLSGMADAEICEKLCISNSTLKKHNSRIYGKLGVKNRIQLRNFALACEKNQDYFN